MTIQLFYEGLRGLIKNICEQTASWPENTTALSSIMLKRSLKSIEKLKTLNILQSTVQSTISKYDYYGSTTYLPPKLTGRKESIKTKKIVVTLEELHSSGGIIYHKDNYYPYSSQIWCLWKSGKKVTSDFLP